MSNDARGRAWPYRVAAWICDEEMCSEYREGEARELAWPWGVGRLGLYCTVRVAVVLTCSVGCCRAFSVGSWNHPGERCRVTLIYLRDTVFFRVSASVPFL